MSSDVCRAAARPLARKDRAQQVALFRYQLIREAADIGADVAASAGRLVRALAAAEHAGPSGQRVRYSRDTLDRWIRAWQRAGSTRSCRGTGPPARDPGDRAGAGGGAEAGEPAPHRGAGAPGSWPRPSGPPSESTLLRHFRTLDDRHRHARRRPRPVRGRRPERAAGSATRCTGPRIGGRKTYLFAFLDDHTRLVTGLPVRASPRTPCGWPPRCDPALAARGVPARGSMSTTARRSSTAWLLRACAKLGIRLVHSRARPTPGPGQDRTILPHRARAVPRRGHRHAGRGPRRRRGRPMPPRCWSSTRLFTAWVETVYHRRIHYRDRADAAGPLGRWLGPVGPHRRPCRRPMR